MAKKRVSDEMILVALEQGGTQKEMAERLGITQPALNKRLAKLSKVAISD